MNPQDIISQGRAKLVAELNMGHLTEEEQTQILDRLGEVLTKKVMAKVIMLLPVNEREHLTTLIEAGQEDAAQALMNKFVPDLAKVAQEEILAGIEEHKRLVNEAVAGQAASEVVGSMPAAPTAPVEPSVLSVEAQIMQEQAMPETPTAVPEPQIYPAQPTEPTAEEERRGISL